MRAAYRSSYLIERLPAKGRPGLATRLRNNMVRLLRAVEATGLKPHDSLRGYYKKLKHVETGR